MLKIDDIMLSVPCMLAPMAGVSDLPFRLINRTFGAPMAFTEMIDARALSHNDKRTLRMLSTVPDDRPLGVQLLGNNGEHILKALDILDGHEFDLLDFNAACPTAKITRNGKGAALLREPRKLQYILKMLVCRSKVPVTVKIRAGWDSDSINAREVALYAEDAGVSALFIHGRTKTQGYSGIVDYQVIKEVKEALKIPVIASGDGVSLSFIKKMFNETGCDGVAIARGALGNPWIFRDVIRFFQNEMLCERPDINERIEIMKRHINLLVQYYGEKKSVSCFHKFFIWYTRGLSGMRPLRDRAFRTGTIGELLNAVEELRSLDGTVG
jgi:tRNA-dihydrouridine synthase B